MSSRPRRSSSRYSPRPRSWSAPSHPGRQPSWGAARRPPSPLRRPDPVAAAPRVIGPRLELLDNLAHDSVKQTASGRRRCRSCTARGAERRYRAPRVGARRAGVGDAQGCRPPAARWRTGRARPRVGHDGWGSNQRGGQRDGRSRAVADRVLADGGGRGTGCVPPTTRSASPMPPRTMRCSGTSFSRRPHEAAAVAVTVATAATTSPATACGPLLVWSVSGGTRTDCRDRRGPMSQNGDRTAEVMA